jgi:anti-anti-sigma factor
MIPTEPSSGTVSYRSVGPHHPGADEVIWLAGEHDSSTVAALIETMARAIAIDDADLVVDVSGVQFMGAETVEVLVRARDYLRMRSRSLTLRSPAACVLRALELCAADEDLLRCAAEPAHLTGPAAALGTWVWVPATARSGRASSGPEPGPDRAAEVAGAGRAPPRDVAAAQVARPAGGRRVGLGRRRGP